MIEAFKQPVKGGFLVTTYHKNGNLPVIFNKLTIDTNRADVIIQQQKKEVLRDKVTKYLNHRKNLMENYGALSTQQKYQAIETMKANLSIREKSSLESNCRLIVDYAELLKLLLPGKSSVYHQSATETINEILEFCTLELKITI